MSSRPPIANPLWHSWDPHPWDHPWLTRANLAAVREFSREFFARELRCLERGDPRTLNVGFCGNIANSMYVRAKPLRRAGLRIRVYLHPQDGYVMSHPGWEEYDGTLPPGTSTLADLAAAGIRLPDVPAVRQLPQVDDWQPEYSSCEHDFLRRGDVLEFAPYLCFIRTLIALQQEDVLWCTQAPYLGYLSQRPYVASQSGGDMWFEAARQDMLGRLMRASFGGARVLLASNPWSFAHARRYGFRQMVYLPKILDENDYHPGPGTARAEWQARSGGDFFVLTTSRLDERNKGSSIGLRGFAQFCRSHPGARLVFVGWGKDADLLSARLQELGIHDRVLGLPISGKARLRDYLRSADAFIDQFVLGYFGSAGLEAMACGLPVLGRIEADQYGALCETGAPPIENCAGAGEVAASLGRLAADPEHRRAVAAAHSEWFVRNHGARRWRDEHLALLAATAAGLPADFSGSPLAAPAGEDETAYLAAGLAAAPKTQEYGW